MHYSVVVNPCRDHSVVVFAEEPYVVFSGGDGEHLAVDVAGGLAVEVGDEVRLGDSLPRGNSSSSRFHTPELFEVGTTLGHNSLASDYDSTRKCPRY